MRLSNSFSQFRARCVISATCSHVPTGERTGAEEGMAEQIIVVPAIIEHSHLINRVRIADSSRLAWVEAITTATNNGGATPGPANTAETTHQPVCSNWYNVYARN